MQISVHRNHYLIRPPPCDSHTPHACHSLGTRVVTVCVVRRHSHLSLETSFCEIDRMECQFALTGKGYVLVASDTTAARSIVKMKHDEDKIKTLGPQLLMSYSGEPGKDTNCTCVWCLHNRLQVTLCNSLNISNGTSVSTKFATFILCVHHLPHRGSVDNWQIHFVRVRHMP